MTTETEIDTHGLVVDFGKYKGQRWTRIPVSYLRWLANQEGSKTDIARAELGRRGIGLHDRAVEVSGHAIDSASLRLHGYYRRNRRDSNEGLHAWLQRFAEEALNDHEMDAQGRIHYEGVRLVFEDGSLYPILKTVMTAKNNRKRSRDMRHFDNVDKPTGETQ